MALSPAHRFGQIIGEIIEQSIEPMLADFAKKHGLYLDKKGVRPARRGQKCTWKDLNGNIHDLDYVLEKGGTASRRGIPAAFIEIAWRRYTKHSRNKAQEIQGAIVPLVETYRNAAPFMGAILAGVFTDGALTQLKSLGFTVLYFPYESVVTVFRQFGIDAAFDEDTPEPESQEKVDAYGHMPESTRKQLSQMIVKVHQDGIDAFIQSLTAAVLRQIERIVVLPLHGKTHEVATVDDAVKFLESYDDESGGGAIQRYEVLIRYNNGDRIEAMFRDKESAIIHLRSYAPLVQDNGR